MKLASETLAARLKRLRAAKGLTTEDVAVRIGAAHQTVRTWEMTGRRRPAAKFVRALAEVLGCDPADLLP